MEKDEIRKLLLSLLAPDGLQKMETTKDEPLLGTPEYVAFLLMEKAAAADMGGYNSEVNYWLDLYAKCLKVVKGETEKWGPLQANPTTPPK